MIGFLCPGVLKSSILRLAIFRKLAVHELAPLAWAWAVCSDVSEVVTVGKNLLIRVVYEQVPYDCWLEVFDAASVLVSPELDVHELAPLAWAWAVCSNAPSGFYRGVEPCGACRVRSS